MNYLLYASIATIEFTHQALADLLAKARYNNQLAGITGMLLFKKGTFMQILEGEGKALHALHVRLMRDPRHRNIVILSEGSLPHREFPEWSMAFEKIDDGAQIHGDGFVHLSEVNPEEVPDSGGSGRAMRLLRRFSES